MKKTTYMMLGAIVAGLIAIPGAIGLVMRSHVVDVRDYSLGGETRCVKLPGIVHKVTYDDSKAWRIDNFKGIAVAESDTARTATLVTTEGWMPYLKCETDSGMLTVKVDYDAVIREYCDENGAKWMTRLRSEDFVAARVIMPRGWLREVYAGNKTLYLDSVKAKEILSKVDDRLVLTNSHLGVLNSRAKKINELKLENSTIDDAVFRAVNNRFVVKCTSEASVIDRLYIDSVYRNNDHLNLKFRDANIRDFKFNPADKKTVINVESRGSL